MAGRTREARPGEGLRSLAGDILSDGEYLRLREFAHHGRSVYDHCVDVANLSLALGELLGLRRAELARGALLHDFFLYDWRTERRPGGSMHAFSHPRLAEGNAERRFGPQPPLVRDIILHHMWPVTPIPPLSPEALVVCLADKAVAAREFRRSWSGRLRRAIGSRSGLRPFARRASALPRKRPAV